MEELDQFEKTPKRQRSELGIINVDITLAIDCVHLKFLLSPAATRSGDIEMPGVRPSVRPSHFC